MCTNPAALDGPSTVHGNGSNDTRVVVLLAQNALPLMLLKVMFLLVHSLVPHSSTINNLLSATQSLDASED